MEGLGLKKEKEGAKNGKTKHEEEFFIITILKENFKIPFFFLNMFFLGGFIHSFGFFSFYLFILYFIFNVFFCFLILIF